MSFSGSYNSDDVIFLLKEINGLIREETLEVREEAIQRGRHYSEMLPQEYTPSPGYVRLFHDTLVSEAQKLAFHIGVLGERIRNLRGSRIVLVSLARAGTPIGILVKRYLLRKMGISLPHYSISIIRDKGIDKNALLYILKEHPGSFIQFIDGWTGKGVIKRTLEEACRIFATEEGAAVDSSLAVLSDPGYCSEIFGTREDIPIPSAFLNATVCGLVSRSVLRDDLIGKEDFHGVKYYRELADKDLSYVFIDGVAKHFAAIEGRASQEATAKDGLCVAEWRGMEEMEGVRRRFGISHVNYVKPGIGETTRVLLRRYPWKILVRNRRDKDLRHITMLAEEKGVSVEEEPNLCFKCCGIIKEL